MDRLLYKAAMQRLLGAQPGLDIHDEAVTDLLLQRAGSAGQQGTVAGILLASGEAQLPHCGVQTLLRAVIQARCSAELT